ncbi:hypothetical protein DD238_008351 [Peronospora effusa]|uniref:Uncharacterized protein n=1 Tax=Peronospora effusa TaxID=542832 RepID=A0A3M6V7K5_9STRA|nr:hypothetical protein DD238_008351 [Peronospora effusa]
MLVKKKRELFPGHTLASPGNINLIPFRYTRLHTKRKDEPHASNNPAFKRNFLSLRIDSPVSNY